MPAVAAQRRAPRANRMATEVIAAREGSCVCIARARGLRRPKIRVGGC